MKPAYASLATVLLFLGALAAVGQSLSRDPQEIIVVMALSVDPQALPEEIRQRARDFTAQLRTQPGSLGDVILKSTLPGSRPDYLLVMRWRQREDWEAMLTNPNIWGPLEKSAKPFKLERAAYFTQFE